MLVPSACHPKRSAASLSAIGTPAVPYAYALLVTSVFNMASTSSNRTNHSTNNGGGGDGVADGESQILGGASPFKLRPAHGQTDTSKCIKCQETKRKEMTNKP